MFHISFLTMIRPLSIHGQASPLLVMKRALCWHRNMVTPEMHIRTKQNLNFSSTLVRMRTGVEGLHG
jgi:hypothetical protein